MVYIYTIVMRIDAKQYSIKGYEQMFLSVKSTCSHTLTHTLIRELYVLQKHTHTHTHTYLIHNV
jgi:hypothetical protein